MDMSETTNTTAAVKIDTEIAKHSELVASARQHVEHSTRFDGPEHRNTVEAQAKLDVALEAFSEANTKYEGWDRFFLVANTNGHIHTSTSCSTCNYRTQFVWLVELAALTVDDALEEYGSILCSVCFPDAPVEHTNGVNKKDAAHKQLTADLKVLKKTKEFKKWETTKRNRDYTLQSIKSAQWRIENLNEYLTTTEHADELNSKIADVKLEVEILEAKLTKTQAAFDAADEVLHAALAS
jgi:uncharacterized small protein (DUF1192 family)